MGNIVRLIKLGFDRKIAQRLIIGVELEKFMADKISEEIDKEIMNCLSSVNLTKNLK